MRCGPRKHIFTLEKSQQNACEKYAHSIHVEQKSDGIPEIGAEITFEVYSTKESANFYYEVISREKVVFTDFTKGNEISFETTPQMTPSST